MSGGIYLLKIFQKFVKYWQLYHDKNLAMNKNPIVKIKTYLCPEWTHFKIFRFILKAARKLPLLQAVRWIAALVLKKNKCDNYIERRWKNEIDTNKRDSQVE